MSARGRQPVGDPPPSVRQPLFRVRLEGRHGWYGVQRDTLGRVYWCPAPFVVVFWTGSMRVLGLVIMLAAILGPVLVAPAPWSVLFAVWLGWPGAVLLWWAWRAGRLL